MTRQYSAAASGHVQSLVRACGILRAFRGENESLRVQDIVERTGLHKATVSRLAATLHAAGFLRRSSTGRYSSGVRFVEKGRYKIGYASETENLEFSQQVTASLHRAAENAGIELISLDNRFNAKSAIANAERLVKERVDLAIEFQAFDSVAPVVSAILQSAGIPVIAVDIPHPGAIYYGVNNYDAGLIAGRTLGQWAKKCWNGKVDRVLIIEFAPVGRLPQLRLTGALAGIREVLPQFPDSRVVRVEGHGSFRRTLTKVRHYLRIHGRLRTLVVPIIDECGLGALRAFEEAGVAENCAVVGQGAIAEARNELRSAGTRLIGSVAFFPEKYGPALLRLARDLLEHKTTPAALFTEHRLITAQNVDRFYGTDAAPMRI